MNATSLRAALLAAAAALLLCGCQREPGEATVGQKLDNAIDSTQQNLAADAGMNQNWVARMENGEENVTVGQLDKLAKALNVETAELFKREDAKAAQPAKTPQPAAASKRLRK